MTYQDAINQGYKAAEQTYQRGYVSRRANIAKQPVLTAGGRRKGQKYILVPCWESTQYCIRQYLSK